MPLLHVLLIQRLPLPVALPPVYSSELLATEREREKREREREREKEREREERRGVSDLLPNTSQDVRLSKDRC